jgi:hypothetical protein
VIVELKTTFSKICKDWTKPKANEN